MLLSSSSPCFRSVPLHAAETAATSPPTAIRSAARAACCRGRRRRIEVADSTTATGRRLAIPIEAMPKNVDDVVGRSAVAESLGRLLADRADARGVPDGRLGRRVCRRSRDPDASLAADSPIVLLDMDTGERAPFFAEVDQNTTDVTKRDLIIRPLARLQPGAHYAVAIRKTVKAADGGELPIPAAFAALRRRRRLSTTRASTSTRSYNDMFAALATRGRRQERPRARVGLPHRVRRVHAQRPHDDARRRAARDRHDRREPDVHRDGRSRARAGIYKSYVGTFKSPDFLTDGETDDSVMRRDAERPAADAGHARRALRGADPGVRDDRSRCRARRSCSATACSARRRSTSTTTS